MPVPRHTARWLDAVLVARGQLKCRPIPPPEFLLSIIQRESAGQPTATSYSNAHGLMQVRPISHEFYMNTSTGAAYPVTHESLNQADTAIDQIRVGAVVASACARRARAWVVSGERDELWRWTLAAYGAGPGAISSVRQSARDRFGVAKPTLAQCESVKPDSEFHGIRPWHRARELPALLWRWREHLDSASNLTLGNPLVAVALVGAGVIAAALVAAAVWSCAS